MLRGGAGGIPSGAPIDYRYFLAGGICAAFSHGITVPIDVVKTKIQTCPEVYDRGMIKATKKVIKRKGAAFLLQGMEPTLVGYGVEGALKFGFYETFKILLRKFIDDKALTMLLASVLAGGMASIVLCPIEDTRIKMLQDPAYIDDGLISGLTRLFKTTGFASFNGFGAMLAKQIPYTIGKQVSFDVFARMVFKLIEGSQESRLAGSTDLKFLVPVIAGFFASIIACVFSQPGDLMLSSMYGDAQKPNGFYETAVSIFEDAGVGGFFCGIQMRLLHVALIITSQLVIYDFVKQAVGLAATGSGK
jgi:solute carrier family 25 phosphate transporter 3